METERLIIDSIRECDKADYFYNIAHDKKVLETFMCNYEEKLEDFDFSNYIGNKALFAIRLKATGKLIGIFVICSEDEESCEIGYAIGSEYWNRGYVTEGTKRFLTYCFDEKGKKSVFASFFTGNEGSKRVMEKCGMTYDHFAEKELTYMGVERDITYYCMKVTGYTYITLREKPELKERAAQWFSSKWRVPKEAYLACMDEYLNQETEYGWYLCLDGEDIIGGMGVIENDFHNRKDLTPNVCAVYTEEQYRCRGIAGHLLTMVVNELKEKAITPVYLLTDHTGFYERYGWEFFCMVQGDGEEEMSRMYIHR